MHGRKHRTGALGGKHRIGVDLLPDRIGHFKAQSTGCLDFLQVPVHRHRDELLVGRAVQTGIDDVVVAKPGNLLGLEALTQRPLHINERKLAGHGMEHISICVAVFHTTCCVCIHLIEIATDKYQQFRVIRLPRMGVLHEVNQATVEILRRPGHDLHDGLLELQRRFKLLGLIRRQGELRMMIAGRSREQPNDHILLVSIRRHANPLVFVTICSLGQPALHIPKEADVGRQFPVGKQAPHIHVVLDLALAPIAVNGPVPLEFIEHENSRSALGDRGV